MERFDPLKQNKAENDAGKVPTAGEILAGEEGKDLAESMRTYTLENGDMVWAGTDKGIGYKDHNEDRVVVAPGQNFLAVVDGMGGPGQGDIAAQILAEELLASPSDLNSVVIKAQGKMADKDMYRGGALFISALVRKESGAQFVDVAQIGDAKLLVIKKDGKVVFKSKDQSIVQDLVDHGQLTADAALYDQRRNLVLTAVSPQEKYEEVKTYASIQVEQGDFVILMSDGISDNLTAEEIAKDIRAEGLSAQELFEWLSDATTDRMAHYTEIIKASNREKDGKYVDGRKSMPKPDNRALIIIEIK